MLSAHADERAFDLCISLRWLHGHPCFVCGVAEFGEVAVAWSSFRRGRSTRCWLVVVRAAAG